MTIIDGLHKKLTSLLQHHVTLTDDALCSAEDAFQSFVQRASRNVIVIYGTVVAKEEC